MAILPSNSRAIDPHPSNQSVVDPHPSNLIINSPTTVYSDSFTITQGMWLGMGLFTYSGSMSGTMQRL